MRCPKCGYNSFDHNLTCPKCRRDLTAARKILNLNIPTPRQTDFFALAAARIPSPEPFIGHAYGGDGLAEEIMPEPPLEEIMPIETAAEGFFPPGSSPAAVYSGAAQPQQPYAGAAQPQQPYAGAAQPQQPYAGAAQHQQPYAGAAQPYQAQPETGTFYPEQILEQPYAAQPETDAFYPEQPSGAPGGDEIEIELDDIEEVPSMEPPLNNEFMASPDVTSMPAALGHNAAIAQIKTTLAETGDLSAPPAFAGTTPPPADFGRQAPPLSPQVSRSPVQPPADVTRAAQTFYAPDVTVSPAQGFAGVGGPPPSLGTPAPGAIVMTQQGANVTPAATVIAPGGAPAPSSTVVVQGAPAGLASPDATVSPAQGFSATRPAKRFIAPDVTTPAFKAAGGPAATQTTESPLDELTSLVKDLNLDDLDD
ncbi:MAG: hypothetical protein LBS31_10210 [Candidatus Adiutrix sp.]|jgi:hypothetical protein|nr:hypothetical protein [Candidatus Adiutrix sp.]